MLNLFKAPNRKRRHRILAALDAAEALVPTENTALRGYLQEIRAEVSGWAADDRQAGR